MGPDDELDRCWEKAKASLGLLLLGLGIGPKNGLGPIGLGQIKIIMKIK